MAKKKKQRGATPTRERGAAHDATAARGEQRVPGRGAKVPKTERSPSGGRQDARGTETGPGHALSSAETTDRPSDAKRPHSVGRSRQGPRDRAGRLETTDTRTVLFGHHAVAAALSNSARRIRSFAATEPAAKRLAAVCAKRGVEPAIVTGDKIAAALGSDAVHQGVMLVADPLENHAVPELATRLIRRMSGSEMLDGGPSSRPLIVALDQVTDPHNVGAILRSAAVFGVGGLIMTHRNSPPLGGVLAKAASGGLERVAIAQVANLARALDQVQDAGFVVIGLDAGGDQYLDDERDRDPAAVVLGAEDTGLRRLTRERCDRIVSIRSATPMTSLNVSNAAAIAFHALAIGG